jgi:hypothetical protein
MWEKEDIEPDHDSDLTNMIKSELSFSYGIGFDESTDDHELVYNVGLDGNWVALLHHTTLSAFLYDIENGEITDVDYNTACKQYSERK